MHTDAPVEEVLSFECGHDRLWGILARPPASRPQASIAVLILVGGPQYRVGSQRQFVRLARHLAQGGFPVLRFDCRGMGDSEGEMQSFESAGPDLQAALGALRASCPQAERVVVWGLCDAASAALMFATGQEGVAGIVAANPWARSTSSLAATHVKHYYGSRLMQPEFWAKLFSGGTDWRASLRSFARDLRGASEHWRSRGSSMPGDSFQARMAKGLSGFGGGLLLILSGQDLTAREFLQHVERDPDWRGLLVAPKVTRIDLPEADHTFSSRAWFKRVERETLSWLDRLAAAEGDVA